MRMAEFLAFWMRECAVFAVCSRFYGATGTGIAVPVLLIAFQVGQRSNAILEPTSPSPRSARTLRGSLNVITVTERHDS